MDPTQKQIQFEPGKFKYFSVKIAGNWNDLAASSGGNLEFNQMKSFI